MPSIEDKLKQKGWIIPDAPKPVAAYVPGVQCGDLIYTSGQLPSVNGEIRKGKLGDNLSISEGYEAAKICALNCLSVIKSIAGDLDRIAQIVKVVGFEG